MTSNDGDIQLPLDKTDVRHGPFRLVRLMFEAAGTLDYRLSSE